MSESERAFLNEIGRIHTYWLQLTMRNLTSTTSPFKNIGAALSEKETQYEMEKLLAGFSHGILHSLLVALDGGSQLVDHAPLSLIDRDGNELCKYLHELLPDYLEKIDVENL